MTARIKVQTEMWEFMVIPGKFIKATPTEKNRYACDYTRLYTNMHSFGLDFGDHYKFETIKEMWGEK